MNLDGLFNIVWLLLALYLAVCVVAIIYAPWWLALILSSPALIAGAVWLLCVWQDFMLRVERAAKESK